MVVIVVVVGQHEGLRAPLEVESCRSNKNMDAGGARRAQHGLDLTVCAPASLAKDEEVGLRTM